MMTTVLNRPQNQPITAHTNSVNQIQKSSLTKHYLSMTSSCVWPIS